ncbi:MAG: CDP-alcohol phosphatidyltransferase family protein [Clostridiaceae bacterium]|nr:CDP-alcohol phosphatidyltransferase family protein [Clostridiaceae bacterium]
MLGFYNYTVWLTYLGAASGIYGIISSLSRGSPRIGVLCLMLSGLCDMFDGAVAKTKTSRTTAEKRFGVQIDSLSDLICFGVLPACIGYSIGLKKLYQLVILISYALAALIRLAYFNVMEERRQDTETGKREQYEGLPVTNSALLFPFIFVLVPYIGIKYMTLTYGFALVFVAMAFLINFKVKKLDIKGMLFLVVIGLIEMILLVTGNVVF